MKRIGLITIAILLMAFPVLSQVINISADQTKNQTDINLTDLAVKDIVTIKKIIKL